MWPCGFRISCGLLTTNNTLFVKNIEVSNSGNTGTAVLLLVRNGDVALYIYIWFASYQIYLFVYHHHHHQAINLLMIRFVISSSDHRKH